MSQFAVIPLSCPQTFHYQKVFFFLKKEKSSLKRNSTRFNEGQLTIKTTHSAWWYFGEQNVGCISKRTPLFWLKVGMHRKHLQQQLCYSQRPPAQLSFTVASFQCCKISTRATAGLLIPNCAQQPSSASVRKPTNPVFKQDGPSVSHGRMAACTAPRPRSCMGSQEVQREVSIGCATLTGGDRTSTTSHAPLTSNWD